MSTIRTLTTIFITLKIVLGIQIPIRQPDTVLVPVSYDDFSKIEWLISPDYMKSTCGTYKAYKSGWKMVYRLFVEFASKNDFLQSFFKLDYQNNYLFTQHGAQRPCGCMGVDFTLDMGDGLISFVMFATNENKNAVTYDMVSAATIGRNQIHMNQIVIRRIVVNESAKLYGHGGYVVPNAVVVDTDNYNSYIILLFCLEKAQLPTVIVLSRNQNVAREIRETVFAYLREYGLDNQLLEINHESCGYARRIVGT